MLKSLIVLLALSITSLAWSASVLPPLPPGFVPPPMTLPTYNGKSLRQLIPNFTTAPADANDTKESTPPLQRCHLNVALLGDQFATGYAEALTRMNTQLVQYQNGCILHVFDFSKPTSGLVRSDKYDLIGANQMISKDYTQTFDWVLISVGANDNVSVPLKNNLGFLSDAWQQFYTQRYALFVQSSKILAKHPQSVLFIPTPSVRSTGANYQISQIKKLQTIVNQRLGIQALETPSLLTKTPVLEVADMINPFTKQAQLTRLRSLNGFELSAEGFDLMMHQLIFYAFLADAPAVKVLQSIKKTMPQSATNQEQDSQMSSLN